MTSEKRAKSKSADRPKGRREQAPLKELGVQAAAPELPRDEVSWHEQAAFHITFQFATGTAGEAIWRTHAYHNESGGEVVHSGILDQELAGWMRERAGLQAEPPADSPQRAGATGRADTGPLAADLSLQVGELEIEELAIEQEVGGQPGHKRLRARVPFGLAGPTAYLVTAESADYTVQLLACEQATGEATVLASSRQQLRPELLSYAEDLGFAMPSLGSYQLLANVVLPDRGAAAIGLGPLLEVVD